MPTLSEVQIAFRDALLGDDSTMVAREIARDGLAPEARLDIYRHHVLTTLTAVLEAAYPVVCRLVDRRFFAYAADRYARDEPPASPCLFEYGERFPDFLASFPACRDLVYLPDVARLEWAMHAALHAADPHAMDPAPLAAVATDDMARLVFSFDPSVTLLDSPWPVERIWRANQDDAAGAPKNSSAAVVDLAAGGAHLEIRRIDDTVTMRALAPADHALRRALWKGATIGDAVATALAVDPAFDLASALTDLLQERILIGFSVSN